AVLSSSLAAHAARPSALVERVGSTAFLQLRAPSFRDLNARQKRLAYWLCQAAIAVDPIIYDQRSPFGLRQKRLLEEIAAHPAGINPKVLRELEAYTKLFWANRGNHNETTSQKFLPAFTFEELKAAAERARKNGAFATADGDLPALRARAALDEELSGLKASIFDPSFEPVLTAKSPRGGEDILQASANNFYSGVRLADLKGFKEKHALNSRLVKKGDELVEEVYRAGTPDGGIPAGRYALYLRKADGYLEKAAAAARPKQARAIRDLIRYFRTGAWSDWIAFDVAWVQDDAPVDFSIGFVEVYLDARAAKGSMQGFVTVTDTKLDALMKTIAANAQYFERKAPWEDRFKKRGGRPPQAKVVDTLIETADFGVTTIGDNLPNEDEVHEKYGTKSFLFMESSRELMDAGGFKALKEFASSPQEVASGMKYRNEADQLMTALHEIIGHGSGKVLVKGDPASYLKEYYSALEEGRADWMALWNIWDPKLKELGLVSNQQAVARQMYYQAARAPLMQLRRIPRGDTIEEDHERDRALIVN
ncbi:MAG: peptidase M49, partial [Elusimicrobia bacterium]|nr:peptidase M49 [Elusimicrobiota bacterium]